MPSSIPLTGSATCAMPQPGFSRERRVHRSHTPTRLATAQPRLSDKWGHGTPLPGEAASRATTEQRSEARGLWCCVGAGRWGGAASGPRRNGQDELESEFRSGVDNNVYGEKDVRHLWDPQTGKDLIWESLREEAAVDAEQEPLLSGFLHGSVLSHSNFEQALAAVLAQRLASRTLLATHVRNPRCVPSPPPSALPPPPLRAMPAKGIEGEEEEWCGSDGVGGQPRSSRSVMGRRQSRFVRLASWIPVPDLCHGADVHGRTLMGGAERVTQLIEIFIDVLMSEKYVRLAARADLLATKVRDPSCLSYSQALLYYKGFHAIQAHRISHALWARGQTILALALQSRMSEVFAVDIHPGARIG